MYAGPLPEVLFRFEINAMVLEVKFTHREKLDREFRLILGDNGSVIPADPEFDAERITEFMLKPVLFDRLDTPTAA